MIRLTISIYLIFATQTLIAQNYNVKIDTLVDAYVSIGKFNGTILVSEKGAKVYEKSHGYSDVRKGELISSKSIFPIGSLTKPFTALLILKLAEEKKLSINDPINKFIEDYPIGNEITIKHLLTHTAGVYETFKNREYREQINSTHQFTNNEKINFFREEPLDFKPGSKFSYSNSGYDLLGVIIEEASGTTYEQCLQRYIFKPLKMTNSGFDYRTLNKKDQVKGYTYLSKTKQIEADLWNPYLVFSSGALYSSPGDLLKFYKALTSYKIISKGSFDIATTPFLDDYGYGWYIDNISGDKVINHGGNVEGYTSYFLMNPDKDICVILLNNTTSNTIERIGNSIYKILINKPVSLPKPKQAINLTQEILYRYIGNYQVSSNYVSKVTLENGSLIIQANNETKFQLSPEKENVFFIKDEDMEVEFTSTEKGSFQIKIKQGLSTKIGDKVE